MSKELQRVQIKVESLHTLDKLALRHLGGEAPIVRNELRRAQRLLSELLTRKPSR